MRGEIIGNNFELYPTKEEQRTWRDKVRTGVDSEDAGSLPHGKKDGADEGEER
jgi:hypothetical protein